MPARRLSHEKVLHEVRSCASRGGDFRARMAFVGEVLERALPLHSFAAVLLSPDQLRALDANLAFSTLGQTDYLRTYFAHYAVHDPVAPLNERATGELIILKETFTPAELRHNPFAAEFLPYMGVHDVAFAGHRMPNGSVLRFGVNIACSRTGFTRAEKKLLERLNREIARAAFDPVELLDADETVSGIIQFDTKGDLVSVDVSADALLRKTGARVMLEPLAARARAFLTSREPKKSVEHQLTLESGDRLRVRLVRLDARSGVGALAVLSLTESWRERAFEDARLTERQKEVARLVVKGVSNETIARALGVGQDAIRGHLRAIYKKCCVSSRAELAKLVIGSV
ncbi:MAG: response regulator transcription factor [Planctomycetota bacterium]